jgi:hypothetical protein
MKALFSVQEKIPAIWWVVVVRCGSRAADSEFGSCQEEWKGKGKVWK